MCGVAIRVFGIPLGEHVLFLRLQHRKLADFIEITVEAGFAAGNGRQIISGHKAPLSLNRLPKETNGRA
ncbi:hypothetical protein D3C72_2573740 [compost metagenome]